MKLSTWAKKVGVCYRTAWNHYKNGLIKGAYALSTGTIIVPDDALAEQEMSALNRVAIYGRVSSSENKDNLERQAERLASYAAAKGYCIIYVIKEVGSGVNDCRPKLEKLLLKDDYDIILVEHKDRLTRFGFNYLSIMAEKLGKKIEVVNHTLDNDENDIMADFTAIITSFCARLYGKRRSRRRTEKIIEDIRKDDKVG